MTLPRALRPIEVNCLITGFIRHFDKTDKNKDVMELIEQFYNQHHFLSFTEEELFQSITIELPSTLKIKGEPTSHRT